MYRALPFVSTLHYCQKLSQRVYLNVLIKPKYNTLIRQNEFYHKIIVT